MAAVRCVTETLLMKKFIYGLLWAAVCVGLGLSMESCGSDDDNNTSQTSNTCVVTAAVLGGITCEVHTLSSAGLDSVYEVTLTGSNYPLQIDNVNNRIFLLDSLPAGCDISRVTMASFTYQGRSVAIRSLHTAEDTTFVASDSTDYTLPRLITVFASDGSSRSYTVELMVHKESGEEMNWQCITRLEELGQLQEQKLVAASQGLYLFGRKEGQCVMLFSADEGQTWASSAPDKDLMVRSVCMVGEDFYALDAAGNVLCSTDGLAWTVRGTQLFNALIAGPDRLFGLSGGQIWSSTDAGEAWVQDEMADEALLPGTEWCGVVLPSRTNEGFSDVLLTGVDTEGMPSLWRRTLDASGRYSFAWNSLVGTFADQTYPCLKSTAAVVYDEVPLLVGLDADGLLPGIYLSRDRGATWLATEIECPEADAASSVGVASDVDGRLFLTFGGTGQVWRGRLARLGWKTVQKEFYRQARR